MIKSTTTQSSYCLGIGVLNLGSEVYNLAILRIRPDLPTLQMNSLYSENGD